MKWGETMPEYDYGNHVPSYSGGEITRRTSGRMRRLRERKGQSSSTESSHETVEKKLKELNWDSEVEFDREKSELQYQPPQQDEKTSLQPEPEHLLETPTPTSEQKIAALFDSGEQIYQQKDYQSAYDIFTSVVSQQPENQLALFYLGVSAAETGRHIEAISITDSLIEMGSRTVQAYYFQAKSYEALGQLDKARLAYQEASNEFPDAIKAFMRLEQQRLIDKFSSEPTPIEEESKTSSKKNTPHKSSKQSTSSNKTKETKTATDSVKSKSNRSVNRQRFDTTFNQSGKPTHYQREDTTFNQSGKPSKAVETKLAQTANKQVKTETTETQQLNVAELNNVEKLTEAVTRSASALPQEIASELLAIFTPATLATMVSVFAVYIAAHSVGIGQAMDIGMLIAGGIFFGLDAFTIFKDIAGFANAVNAETESDLDKAGQHLASAIAKIGVDAVMTLLTKKVADEVGKTIDHVNQVDEVHAHSDNTNSRRASDADNTNARRNEPSLIDEASDSQFLSQLDEATRNSIDQSLSGLTPVQKQQYLDVIAGDIDKGQKLLEFQNFGSAERFRNVLNAIDSVDDVERLKRVFNEDYFSSLSEGNKKRYQKLLEDVANETLDSNSPTFKERLEVLDEVQNIQRDVEKTVGSEIYTAKGLSEKMVVYSKYEITEISSGKTISDNVVSLSGRGMPEKINGQSPKQKIDVQGNDSRFVPTVSKKDKRLIASEEGLAKQDAERKIFIDILNQLENKTGIKFDPMNQYKGLFKGKIEVNSQAAPCEFCAEMIGNLFNNMFGDNLKVIVKYGADYTKPEGR